MTSQVQLLQELEKLRNEVLWSNPVRQTEIFNTAFKRVLSQQDEILIQAEALQAAAKVLCHHHNTDIDSLVASLADADRDAWRHGNGPRDYAGLRKVRALAVLTAIWGSAVLDHYQWTRCSRDALEDLLEIAVRNKQFETFVHMANSLLIERYELSLSTQPETDDNTFEVGQHEWRSFTHFSGSPLTVNDMKSLAHERPEHVHPNLKERARQLAAISIDDLRQEYPLAQRYYLLGFDQYGMLVPREQRPRFKRSASELDLDDLEVDDASMSTQSRPNSQHTSLAASQQSEQVISTARSESVTSTFDRHSSQGSEGSTSQHSQAHIPTSLERQWLPDEPSWPKAFAPSLPANQYVGTRVNEDEAEVVFLTSDELQAQAKSGSIFTRPIVVRQRFDDQSYLTPAWLLAESYSSLQGKGLPAGQNALNLAPIDANRPVFTRVIRFRLLEALVSRSKIESGPGRQIYTTERGVGDIEDWQKFTTVSFNLASSFAHVDALAGTWMRNLFGFQIWTVVPSNLMSEQDWEDLSRQGTEWNPNGKARQIMLRQGDVLFMPPGHRVVYSVFTRGTCFMNGGRLWDMQNVAQILTSLLWAHDNPTLTDGSIVKHFPIIIRTLREWFEGDPDCFSRGNPQVEVEIRTAIGRLEDIIGCESFPAPVRAKHPMDVRSATADGQAGVGSTSTTERKRKKQTDLEQS